MLHALSDREESQQTPMGIFEGILNKLERRLLRVF